jgi:hypothetical protein
MEDGQSCPSPRESVPEAGIWVDSRVDGQDCPSSTHPAIDGRTEGTERFRANAPARPSNAVSLPNEYGTPPVRTPPCSIRIRKLSRRNTVAARTNTPPARMHTAALPCAYGHPPVCIRQPCRTHMGALPCEYGGLAMRTPQPCRARMASLPYAHGDPAVCVWQPCRMRMARLPCDDLNFRC